MGAQAFGAAQSYAEKQFMRSLFKIATGDDDDADFHQQENLPTTARTTAKPKATESKMTNSDAKWSDASIAQPTKPDDKDGWKQFGANFNRNMKAALGDAGVDLARFNKWVDAHEPALTELGNASATGRDFLDEQITLMQGNLSQKAAA